MSIPLQPLGPILVLAPDRNSPPKNDFTGAFSPAAQALVGAYGSGIVVKLVPVPTVDPETLTIGSAKKQKMFEAAADICLKAITEYAPAHLVFLCHGWSGGLQLGFRSRAFRGMDDVHFEDLCETLKGLRRYNVLHSICLFACSAGDEPASKKSSPGTGNNSFADTLRDATGAPVLAHWSVGHTTYNPDLIFFEASEHPLIGGTDVRRGTKLYKNARSLLSPGTKKNPNPGGLNPPIGDVRRAWLSLPLVTSYLELQELLSQKPVTR